MTKFLTSEKEIKDFLNQYKISGYKLIPDEKYGFVIDVDGDVKFVGTNLKEIPVKFREISGDLTCFGNQLSSLRFCPQKVSSFMCGFNGLTSLEYCPKNIPNGFDCSHNKLTSLEFCPEFVGGIFNCMNNNISSLEFCPKDVGRFFFADNNPGLGEFQKTNLFSPIYEKHLRIKSMIEFKNELESQISSKHSNTKKSKI